MKKQTRSILVVILVMALVSLACGVNIDLPKMRQIEPTLFSVNEPAPAAGEETRLILTTGAGKLNLEPGAAGLVEGEIRYNVEQWKPTITRNNGVVEIRQETNISGIPPKNTENLWTLKLGTTPIALTIHAGAYEGDFDLSGVALTRLEVNDGASSTAMNFDKVNPVTMNLFSYSTGTSAVELTGLANANFKDMVFKSGAGSYTLDFSGKLQQDGNVRISSGVSNVKITIPDGVPAEVRISGGLNNINPSGTWSIDGNTYRSEGTGPKLIITVDMGVGNLDLIQK